MKKIPLYKYLFGITDVFVMFASFLAALYLLRSDSTLSLIEFTNIAQELILGFFLVSVVFIVIFYYNGLYRLNIVLTRAAHLSHILKALYYGALNIVLVSLLIESSSIVDSRLLIFLVFIIAYPALYLVRAETAPLVNQEYSCPREFASALLSGKVQQVARIELDVR